jgi:hypothetical protein
MNAGDVLRYGHQTFLNEVQSIPETLRETPGACGTWSVKDLVAHLGSYEWVLVDVLQGVADHGATPHLDRFVELRDAFNDAEVDARSGRSFAEVMAELEDAHRRTLEIIGRLDAEVLRRPGTLPWYGTEYAVDDLICYQYYGHKREHGAQIAMFRDHGNHGRTATASQA